MAVVRKDEQKVFLPVREELIEEMERMIEERRKAKRSKQEGCIYHESLRYKRIQIEDEDMEILGGKIKNSKNKFRLSLSEVEESEELYGEIGQELGMNFWRKNRVQQGGN